MRLRAQKAVLGLLIVIGLIASGNLLLHIWQLLPPSLWRLPLVLAAVAYVTLQAFFVWLLYWRFAPRVPVAAPPGRSVDVFVTAFDEPSWLVERTLRAAVAIRYPHTTYLLDDGRKAELRELAERVGARYLTREGGRDAKAGNINAALPRTSGDYLVIFDIDHAPSTDFLDRTLGYFENERVGFVQAMLTFSNGGESLIAEAATETSYEYYNVAAVCKDRCGGASLMGSNAVIRRKALESIGGYAAGLAEDLETSVALHSRGWESAYVCEPLAPGLAPSDLPAFFKQQLKWSRGVFEAARSSLGGSFFRLRPPQMLCYAVRFSYYLAGAAIFGTMLFLVASLVRPAFDVEALLARVIPFLLAALAIRVYALWSWATDPLAPRGVHFKGFSLVTSAWPFYLVALLSTLFRIPIPFIPTPKTAAGRVPGWAFLPQGLAVAGLVLAVCWRLLQWDQQPMPLTVSMALLFVAMHWILFAAMLESPSVVRAKSPATQADATP